MKFMLTFSWTPDAKARAEGIGRFQKTGGLPPEGVKLLGRWTRTDLSAGFDLLETDDPRKLTEFSYISRHEATDDRQRVRAGGRDPRKVRREDSRRDRKVGASRQERRCQGRLEARRKE